MARKKKTYAEQLAEMMAKYEKMGAKIQKFREDNSKKWFDKLNDILQKGIDDGSISFEAVKVEDIFNFCVTTTAKQSNSPIKDNTTEKNNSSSELQNEIKDKTAKDKNEDNKSQEIPPDEKKETTEQDESQKQDADWGPVVYMS